MPGNVITINSSDDLVWKWYVRDSKMDKLIEVLNKIGYEYRDVGIEENSKHKGASELKLWVLRTFSKEV